MQYQNYHFRYLKVTLCKTTSGVFRRKGLGVEIVDGWKQWNFLIFNHNLCLWWRH